jgi:hypothetical protein
VYRRNAVPGRVHLAHSALPDDVLGCYGTVDERRLYGYAVGLRHSARARAAGPGARRASVCNCIVRLCSVYNAIGSRCWAFIVSNFLYCLLNTQCQVCI